MRTRITLLAVALLLMVGFALPQAFAQDSMTHTCDSTLISLLYIAEHDYGFHSMMDVSTFDKGQYGPLFDQMMAEMQGDEMMATEEAMTSSGGEMMATEEPMMEGTMLTPAVVQGEDQACTDLRAELDAFLYKTLSEKAMMASSGG